MKIFFKFVAHIIIIFIFAACGSGSGSSSSNPINNSQITETVEELEKVTTESAEELEIDNLAPIANAGDNYQQNVTSSMEILLIGNESYDPDGYIVQYEWKQLSGRTVHLSNPYNSTTKFIVPSKSSTLIFELAVTDNHGLIATDQITISVNYVPMHYYDQPSNPYPVEPTDQPKNPYYDQLLPY